MKAMNSQTADKAIEYIAESIEIPEGGYETAKRRYEDLSEWFGRPESVSSRFSPHIYPQGSFRLGTVVRPISNAAEYDLDLGCRLQAGISKTSHTQKQLKELVGIDLQAYRTARRIQEKLEEKPRCWRLAYADTLQFHMDTVPSIPENELRRQLIEKSLTLAGTQVALAKHVAALTGAITDNRSQNYAAIDPNWRISNSEGYALWFESRMKLAESVLQERALAMKMHKVDELPAYRWKSPLQRVVQILKRHRDIMFAASPGSQPISVIITTLSARAYNGERSIGQALRSVLSQMAVFVNETVPRIPNPVNPAEDFADKWADSAYRHLRLEESFWRWLQQAQSDFGAFESAGDLRSLTEHINKSIGTRFSLNDLGAKLGIVTTGGLLRSAEAPAGLGFPNKPLVPSKPAGFA
jgi:hypothetical protein